MLPGVQKHCYMVQLSCPERPPNEPPDIKVILSQCQDFPTQRTFCFSVLRQGVRGAGDGVLSVPTE